MGRLALAGSNTMLGLAATSLFRPFLFYFLAFLYAPLNVYMHIKQLNIVIIEGWNGTRECPGAKTFCLNTIWKGDRNGISKYALRPSTTAVSLVVVNELV